MKTVEATFRIVTPMFMGGATPENSAELRPPSIKGLLRFWWRVFESPLAPGGLREVADKENRVFGGSEKGQGQSIFSIKIGDRKNIKYGNKGNPKWNNNPIAYLGYGPITRDKQKRKAITTRCFIESGEFTVVLQFKPLSPASPHELYRARENDISMVKKAFWAMSMFGGLGARSRKGFGSIVPIAVNGMDNLPSMMVENQNELEKSIREFLLSCQKEPSNAKYTRFSNNSRCVILGVQDASNEFTTGEKALKWLGESIFSIRSAQGSKRKLWATQDRDLVKPYVKSGTPPTKAPHRSIFGLPHNYFFPDLKRGAELNIVDNDKKGRRASPLFFSVYQFDESKKCCIIALYLPAQFLPDNTKLTFSKEGEEKVDVDPPNDFSPITDLMDELKQMDGKEVSWATI